MVTPEGGLDMDGLTVQQLPVGLETDDLMLVLQEGGERTLPIL